MHFRASRWCPSLYCTWAIWAMSPLKLPIRFCSFLYFFFSFHFTPWGSLSPLTRLPHSFDSLPVLRSVPSIHSAPSFQIGLCPQVIGDLSEEGQRSKVRGKYLRSGDPPAGGHAWPHCDRGAWLACPNTKNGPLGTNRMHVVVGH